jgi:hypothetical protein
MADPRHGALSSAFDGMLAQNKQRFDALYRGGGHAGGAAAGGGAAERRAPSSAPLRLDAASSAAMRLLNERFGEGWRYELAAQPREGDEAIVMAKLILAKDGTVKTQFGRARIAGGPLAGSAGGVKFRLKSDAAEQNEAEAYRQAAEAALSKCIELL